MFPQYMHISFSHTFSHHILHALLKKGVSACFADDEVCPLHHHNAHKEGCVTSEFYNLALLIGLNNKKKHKRAQTELSNTILLLLCIYFQINVQVC